VLKDRTGLSLLEEVPVTQAMELKIPDHKPEVATHTQRKVTQYIWIYIYAYVRKKK